MNIHMQQPTTGTTGMSYLLGDAYSHTHPTQQSQLTMGQKGKRARSMS